MSRPLILAVLILSGCAAFQKADTAAQAKAGEDAAAAIAATTGTVAPFLPPPFNLLAPAIVAGILGVASVIRGKPKP